MKRSAFAQWHGDLKSGNGSISTESGSVSNTPYSFANRFGDVRGTNPEELIGAAHSGCFAMALSGELDKRKLKAETIDVKAEVSLENGSDGWGITTVHLIVSANVPGATEALVQEAAQAAKKSCPVSKLLKANITMDLTLAEEEEPTLTM